MYTSVRLRHVTHTAPHQHHTHTAHSVPVDTRSLTNNGLDDTTRTSLKEAAKLKTGFTLDLYH